VSTTILPEAPISGDLSPERIADLVNQAATLIETDGLEVGGYWTEALLRPYEPGDRCCTVGALSVVCGYRQPGTVEDDFLGLSTFNVETRSFTAGSPHPVFTAAAAALGFRRVEDLYDWSDKAGDAEVVEALREAAAKIRARGGAA
jgi:hypothetical protein